VSELRLRGEGGQVVVQVDGYVHPDASSGLEGNLLAGRIDADVGSTGSFRASKLVNLYTVDLNRFRDELSALDVALTGEATLTNIDSDFHVTVRLDHGKGFLSGVVLEWGRRLTFEEIKTDQTFLHDALHELDAILQRLPVRGDPYL
jgi:hypothetical protein